MMAQCFGISRLSSMSKKTQSIQKGHRMQPGALKGNDENVFCRRILVTMIYKSHLRRDRC